MNSVIFYYPYPRAFEKTYGNAVRSIRENGLLCEVTDNQEELPKIIHRISPLSRKVLILSHSIPRFEIIGNCLWKNVFYFGGQSICKSLQFSILRQHGLNVPDWITYPTSKDEVFEKLGKRVVAKTNESAATARRGVYYVTPNNFPIQCMHKYVFTKYEGEDKAPYWKARVVALFGEILFAHMIHKNTILVGGEDSTDEYNPDPYDRVWSYYTCLCDKKLLDMGRKASKIMSDECGCGIMAIDMVGNERGEFIVEANPTVVCLAHDVEPWDHRFNRAKTIATACTNKINELI